MDVPFLYTSRYHIKLRKLRVLCMSILFNVGHFDETFRSILYLREQKNYLFF